MAGNEQREATASSRPSNPRRPNLTLPPRPSSFTDALFAASTPGGGGGFGPPGFSPGPMTLVSSFFAAETPDSDFKSFSHLLAGAMSSPRPPLPVPDEGKPADGRLANLSIAPPAQAFTMPPGLSPLGGGFLDSPGFAGLFSPQGPYGITHQQALAQVTSQAANLQSQAGYSASLHVAPTSTSSMQFPPFSSNSTSDQKMPLMQMSDSIVTRESSDNPYASQRPQPATFAVDKPADDGYNWRKYGQKQVKGSEFPRSYYKCTHPNCPVTKKVERSLEGLVTEIIYKGQHNHQPPQSNKRGKDAGTASSNNHGNLDLPSQHQSGKMKDGKDQVPSQATFDNVSARSDSEEGGDTDTAVGGNDEDEPEAKRRNTEVGVTEVSSSHRTVTEPRIIVQTTSEVDLLDDGFRWRKYGQKVVKGNPYPRSYYKCTTPGCNVRKHVERAAADPRAVITTYEGKHNHDVPTAKNSSHNTANSSTSQTYPSNRENNPMVNQRDYVNSNQQSVARLRLKEEQIT